MANLLEINSLGSNAPASAKHQANQLAVTKTKAMFTVEDIQKLLPHRYPLFLIDRIVEYVPGQRAVGIKNVTFNEPHFQGHFPGQPLMPGVLIVEAMAQVGGFVLTQMPEAEGRMLLFSGINKVRFRRPVVPGDQMVITAELSYIKRHRLGKMQTRAEISDQLASEGELLFSLTNTF